MISSTDKPATETCDVVIRGGQVFDGAGLPALSADVAILDGKVQAVGPRLPQTGRREIQAAGCWVMPGMLDIHTHYDAEIEAMPGLGESVRHGVTTVVMGNCSLSTALGSKKDILDLFCRVESLPREVLSKWIGDDIPWHGVREYYAHLDRVPIGPNVASFIGHSNVRAHVMGMERSLKVAKAEPREIRAMQEIVDEALAEGYLGLSIDMLPWHRLDGEPFQGISVPSQHAHPSEYRSLARVVRRRNRVLQATPNALTKSTVAILGMLSTGVGRKPLRTTIVAAMDMKTDRKVYRIATTIGAVLNKLFRANIRWQTLAEPFLNYCDGVHTPLFEELPSGVEAITAGSCERRRMFADPEFRRAFRRDWTAAGARIFHRNLADMWVVSSPISGQEGKSFDELARAEGREQLDFFMDLLAEHDSAIRWKTVVTNDRALQRQFLFTHDSTLPGFNDSGAHVRNMAFQDGGLQMLQQVLMNPGLMPIEKAISKLTGQSAEWLGLDAGLLRPGAWADVIVVDPEKLQKGLGPPIEHYDEGLHGAMRMVKRSDGVVRQVLVGGRLAFENGQFVPEFGRQRFGRLLRSQR
ncbi:MAG TPA: amidohydrolase family protein [Pirellulales bacterium]|nr:amidohydrolase family protein [Pirellulales bacterium]